MEDNKMKTIAYNPQREIITALLALFISFTLLTTTRAQGNPDNKEGVEYKAGTKNENGLITAEKVMTESDSVDNFLAVKIESWINSGSYWAESSDEETVENQLADQLADKIETWMKDGSFWSLGSDNKTEIDELVLSEKEQKKEQTNRDVLADDGN
jgi:DNA phosphorothioation-dependent restriction protein DptG